MNHSDSESKLSGTHWLPISINRRLVLDGLHFARRVPLFPAEKYIDVGEISVLRKHAAQRISWAAVFVKAYAVAAQKHRPLRQTYIRWPWPHLVEELHSTAMIGISDHEGGHNSEKKSNANPWADW